MRFDLYHTTIYQAVKMAKNFPPKIIKTINWLVLIFALLLLIVFGSRQEFSGLSFEQVLGAFLILFSLSIFGFIWVAFFENYFKKGNYLDSSLEEIIDITNLNYAEYLNFDIAQAVFNAISYSKKNQISLTTSRIILQLLKKEKIKKIFRQLELDEKELKKRVEKDEKELNHKSQILYSDEFLEIIKEAMQQAIANFHKKIELRDFLVAAAEKDKIFIKMLFDNDIDFQDIDHIISWHDFINYQAEWKRKFWKLDNLLKKSGIGKQWAAGYTVNVDKYAVDVTELIKDKDLPLHVIGRKQEIGAIERILSRRRENNVLVVGRPGGGRSTIVYSFAKKILEGRSISILNYKRVLELDMQAIFAGLKTQGEILERFKIIFSEAANAGNVILIIDDIHNYLGVQNGVGSMDISSALVPYLDSPELQIIGVSTFEGFHKTIETNPAVMNFFEKIEIEEPTKEETLFILEDLLPGFEKQYDLDVGYRALKTIINLTDRYIQDIPFPEKAIDFLGEVMVYVKTQTKSKMVLPEHVAQIISQKTKIPAGEIQKPEVEKLLNLEKFIHRRVINQEEAVKVLADAMRRTRAGVAGTERPIGTFLFLGPTGVGKTETSKALAESYFGSESRMIRLDMSEYQSIESIDRLIGSANGKQQGLLTNAIREHPFSLLLLDEIEKAHKNILNLFLQILDEGRLTDGLGRTVSFCNSIIIGTSNAGAELIREYVEKKADYAYSFFKKELIAHLLHEEVFRPEFLNRFDATIIFKPLTKQNLFDIVILMLQKLNNRLMKGRGIQLMVTEKLAKKIAELGYDPEFGARPMNRVIQDKIENKIAAKILKGEAQRGDTIELNPQEL